MVLTSVSFKLSVTDLPCVHSDYRMNQFSFYFSYFKKMSLLPTAYLSPDVESVIFRFFDPRQFYTLLSGAYLSRLLSPIESSSGIVVKFVGAREFLLGGERPTRPSDVTPEEKRYWKDRPEPTLKNAYTKEVLNMARYIVARLGARAEPARRRLKAKDWLFIKSKKNPTEIQKKILVVMLKRTDGYDLPKVLAMAIKTKNEYLQKAVGKEQRRRQNETSERSGRRKKSKG